MDTETQARPSKTYHELYAMASALADEIRRAELEETLGGTPRRMLADAFLLVIDAGRRIKPLLAAETGFKKV